MALDRIPEPLRTFERLYSAKETREAVALSLEVGGPPAALARAREIMSLGFGKDPWAKEAGLLSFAVCLSDPKLVDSVIGSGEANFNERLGGSTPLLIAAALGTLHPVTRDHPALLMTRALLPQSDPLARDAQGRSALMIWAGASDREMVELLLPRSDPMAQDAGGLSALMHVAESPRRSFGALMAITEVSDPFTLDAGGVGALERLARNDRATMRWLAMELVLNRMASLDPARALEQAERTLQGFASGAFGSAWGAPGCREQLSCWRADCEKLALSGAISAPSMVASASGPRL